MRWSLFLFFLSNLSHVFCIPTKTLQPYTYPPSGQNLRGYLPARFFDKGVELDIKKIIYSFVNESDVFYDIGMNAGFYTLYAAALGAQVISFEPQMGCHFYMKSSLEDGTGVNSHLRNKITLIHAALSNRSSIMKIPVGSCNPEYATTWGSALSKVEWNIPVLPARVFQHMYPHINFIKIDTEGAEIPILEDLSHHFNFDYLVVELIPNAWASFDVSVDRATKVLTKLQNRARKTYLLYDPDPFKIQSERVTIPETNVIALEHWTMEAMIQDRLAITKGSGCNILFVFN